MTDPLNTSVVPPEKVSPSGSAIVWKTDVLVIGGGATGAGIARDLALRGISCILAEWRDIASGASGANHGLLHSGARYVAADRESAAECREENEIIKRTAPHCVEDTGGFFVSVAGDDPDYGEAFPALCAAAGIKATSLDPEEARLLEPALSPRLSRVFQVPDASIDPFRLCLDLMADAGAKAGSVYLPHTRIMGFDIRKGRILAARAVHPLHGELRIEAGEYVNAAGAWSMGIAELAGAKIPLVFSKGTLLVTHDRLTTRVINRLRPAGNGDILVPGGTVSVLGTTSVRLAGLDDISPTVAEVEENIREGAPMVPALSTVRYIRAYAGVRPLAGSGSDDRAVSRNFSLIDHSDGDRGGLENFLTISGGKLTTFRLMAEKACDALASRLGVTAPCLTRTAILPVTGASSWTEPGRAARAWLEHHQPDDPVLCECELVQQSAAQEIVDSLPAVEHASLLHSVGLRSRIGKGPCQGAFCSLRLTSALYDNDTFTGREGLEQLIDFLRGRFKGQRSILWGAQLAQWELAEALHCGLFGLDHLACAQQAADTGKSPETGSVKGARNA